MFSFLGMNNIWPNAHRGLYVTHHRKMESFSKHTVYVIEVVAYSKSKNLEEQNYISTSSFLSLSNGNLF